MKLLGVIAEDVSDVDVVSELARKLARKKFATRKFVAHGCGRIHSKAKAWANQLHRQGCSMLVLVCDLDQRDGNELLASLQAALKPCPIAACAVVIPVREIEAWLLADHDAISRALRLPRPMRRQTNPEAVPRPKEKLRDIVRERSHGNVIYLNTVHNIRIAREIRPENLAQCGSFSPFREFVRANLR